MAKRVCGMDTSIPLNIDERRRDRFARQASTNVENVNVAIMNFERERETSPQPPLNSDDKTPIPATGQPSSTPRNESPESKSEINAQSKVVRRFGPF